VRDEPSNHNAHRAGAYADCPLSLWTVWVITFHITMGYSAVTLGPRLSRVSQAYSAPMMMAAKLLKLVGNPAANGVKFFAILELLEHPHRNGLW
jgi:hypothetical protein